jgi:hypothetical protein
VTKPVMIIAALALCNPSYAESSTCGALAAEQQLTDIVLAEVRRSREEIILSEQTKNTDPRHREFIIERLREKAAVRFRDFITLPWKPNLTLCQVTVDYQGKGAVGASAIQYLVSLTDDGKPVVKLTNDLQMIQITAMGLQEFYDAGAEARAVYGQPALDSKLYRMPSYESDMAEYHGDEPSPMNENAAATFYEGRRLVPKTNCCRKSIRC